MRKLLRLLPTLASSLAFGATSGFEVSHEAAFRACVPAGSTLAKLAGDFGFTEGPTWLKSGALLVFSDIPNNELKQWTAAGGIATYRKPSQNANGNTTDASGRLLTCEHSGRRIALQEKDGAVKTLVDSFEGKKLNSPNDVVVKSDGTIWFTDPEYGLKTNPQTKKREGKEQAGNYVFRFDPKAKNITAVVQDGIQPNGLAFSPDEKKLYVADTGGPKHIRVFDVRVDGSVGAGKIFCVLDQGAPDGIRVDQNGRVWSSAGDGVHIYGADGKLIGKILVPEAAANLCFGGDDGKTLFITARKSLYSIKVGVTGAAR